MTSEQTERLGEKLGINLLGGEVIELQSDLGGGKTTLTRGIAKGAGSTDRVASPSFTLSKEYDAPNFVIRHYDYYRLDDAGLMADELADIVDDKAYVVIIEWGEVVSDVIPKERIRIVIERQPETEDRLVTFHVPSRMLYLLDGIGA
jgi:tRNA threonylcarbamoyladenosine biosynthesis protein TsaE